MHALKEMAGWTRLCPLARTAQLVSSPTRPKSACEAQKATPAEVANISSVPILCGSFARSCLPNHRVACRAAFEGSMGGRLRQVPASNPTQSQRPVMLSAWEYCSLCESCHRTGTPDSWSTTGRQIRIEYSCRSCQRTWQVTRAEEVKLPSARELALRARAAHESTLRAESQAGAHITREPPDWVAACGAVVAAIILGGGVVSRLLDVMRLL